ncbi:MAG: hypothetical protein NTX50_09635, partial [Candidatus Sumerlaeota bacterium]|nr:hypothetical protein [Candidatus Sumerlaeota bacterium]
KQSRPYLHPIPPSRMIQICKKLTAKAKSNPQPLYFAPIRNPQSAIRNPQSLIVNRQSSIVNRQSSIANRQSSIVNGSK